MLSMSARTWTRHFFIFIIMIEFLCFPCEGQEVLSTSTESYYSTGISERKVALGSSTSEIASQTDASSSFAPTDKHHSSNVSNSTAITRTDSPISPRADTQEMLLTEVPSTTPFLVVSTTSNTIFTGTSKSLPTDIANSTFIPPVSNTQVNYTSTSSDTFQTDSAESHSSHAVTTQPVAVFSTTGLQPTTQTKLPQITQSTIPSEGSTKSYLENPTYPSIEVNELTSLQTTDFSSENPNVNEINFIEFHHTTSSSNATPAVDTSKERSELTTVQQLFTEKPELSNSSTTNMSLINPVINEVASIEYKETTFPSVTTTDINKVTSQFSHFTTDFNISNKSVEFTTSTSPTYNPSRATSGESVVTAKQTDFTSSDIFETTPEQVFSVPDSDNVGSSFHDENTTKSELNTTNVTASRSEVTLTTSKDAISSATHSTTSSSYPHIADFSSQHAKEENITLFSTASPTTRHTAQYIQTSLLRKENETEEPTPHSSLGNSSESLSSHEHISDTSNFIDEAITQTVSKALSTAIPTEAKSEPSTSVTDSSSTDSLANTRVTEPESTLRSTVQNVTVLTSVDNKTENVSHGYIPTHLNTTHETISQTTKIELVTEPVISERRTVATITEMPFNVTADSSNASTSSSDFINTGASAPYHTTVETREGQSVEEPTQGKTVSSSSPIATSTKEISSSDLPTEPRETSPIKETVTSVAYEKPYSTSSKTLEHTLPNVSLPDRDTERSSNTVPLDTYFSSTEDSLGDESNVTEILTVFGTSSLGFVVTENEIKGSTLTPFVESSSTVETFVVYQRSLRNLTTEEADNIVTVIFRASSITPETWRDEKSGIFENFLSIKLSLILNDIDTTSPHTDSYFHTTHDYYDEDVHPNVDDIVLDDLVYVKPTPFAQGESFIISFVSYRIVGVPGTKSVTPANLILSLLVSNKEELEATIKMKILNMYIGVYGSLNEEVTLSSSIFDRNWIAVIGVSVLGAVCSVTLFLTVMYFRLRNRQSRSGTHDLTHLKGEMNVSGEVGDLNSAADLLRDEMCQKDLPGLVNGGGGHIIKMGDDECWVVPFQDVPLEDKNPPDIQDTRL